MLSVWDQHALSRLLREQLYQWLDQRLPDEILGNEDLHDALGQSSASSMRDLALTLSEKKSRLPCRSICLAQSIAEPNENLTSKDSHVFRSRSNIRIGFVFTGQGAQWARMGVSLMKYAVFRKSVEETRLTRHHKARSTARTRLLGATHAATSGSGLMWRNFLRVFSSRVQWDDSYEFKPLKIDVCYHHRVITTVGHGLSTGKSTTFPLSSPRHRFGEHLLGRCTRMETRSNVHVYTRCRGSILDTPTRAGLA